MDTHRLLTELARPEALPGSPRSVEVVQTHASVVLLAERDVYKLKKPLDLGFLDYSTLERRAHFCREEVRLNRRMAPDVYRGVLPVVEGPDGLRLGGDGEPVEWAVHMRRLPDGATLRDAVKAGALEPARVEACGDFLAGFHAEAEAGPEELASLERVSGNARDNVRSLRAYGADPALVERLDQATEAAIDRHAERIARRAHRCVAIHGDLRLEHVYDLDGRLVIIDGIEFNDAFRFADPVSDIAFLSMDFRAYGDWEAARRLERAWVRASGDEDGAELMPFYVAYRSAVRAKVAAITASEEEVAPVDREAARARVLRHLLLALAVLEPRGPRLVAVGGLPGTGKTTVAREAASCLGAALVRTDVVRKELAGLPPEASAAAAPDRGLYSPAHGERTYAEVLGRARAALVSGRAAVVDGTWSTEARRVQLRRLATELGVPFDLIVCSLDEASVRERIAARSHDASDADFGIYLHARASWQPVTRPHLDVDTSGTPEAVRARVRSLLAPRSR